MIGREAKVQAYEGPGRFVMGFRKDTDVIGDKGFKDFL